MQCRADPRVLFLHESNEPPKNTTVNTHPRTISKIPCTNRIQPKPDHVIDRLALDLGLGGTAPDALRLRALEMLGRDPALVVLAGGNGGTIGTNHRNLLSRVDLLGTTGGLLRTLATLAATLLLREEGGDPGVVDEVNGAAENAEQNEIEEDARKDSQQSNFRAIGETTYICGSKMLVGASTMVTVSL